MLQRESLSTGLSGVAGEYFVAAELSRRGLVATITLRNTRGIDILVSDADATRSVGIQVKTRQTAATEWVLSKSVEEQKDLADNLYFVFVTLNGLALPSYHVVPRSVVAATVYEEHRLWLATPGRSGRAHQDNPVRKFRDPDGRYLDRWEVLGLG